MPLDPSIALGVRPIQIADPLAQYGQIAQLQNYQTQNQLHQMQMREAEATAQERNALRQLNPTSPDYETQLFKVNPQLGIQYRKEQSAAEASRAATAASKVTSAKAKQDMLGQAWRDISSRPSDANITAHLEDILASPLYDDNEKAGIRARGEDLLKLPFEQRQTTLAQIGAKPSDLKPNIITENLGGTSRTSAIPAFGGPSTVISETKKTATPGELMTNARELSRIKLEGERLGNEGRRLALAEETNRREGDPAFIQRMQGARTTGELIAKNDLAAKQALPGAIANAEEAVNLIDQLVGKPTVKDASGKVIEQGTKKHPGFANAVGATWLPGVRFVPGTDAANFQAAFDQVQGAAFLEAFNVLRGAGAITEKEGAKATAARTRMSLSQSETEFTTAAREYQDVIRKGVKIMQQKAGGGAGAAPATGGGAVDTSNPLLK
jgi:hypothetical protein